MGRLQLWMKNLSNVGKRFYKESSAGEAPKIAEKTENTTKRKEIEEVQEVSDDDFVTPCIKIAQHGENVQNSVDIHGQVNEPILIDDRSTGNKSSKQQTSNTNTLEKDGNQDDKSTTSIR
ncbi:hypothetical protein L1987_45545 [Smallanthus sonchifolius]|uniref:Uncharacterized protein n=1 Tax=Smallanthus sonchifolius TaxID=185202 RepID=A0ACB9FXV4_9ASTR|nr:hypothetical protein L1987_45545 [Smallanthus sonchifolius]